MKNKRPEILAVVIGRNRRVYARVYKMENRIEYFSRHYFESEIEKSRNEGFQPVGMTLEKPNNTTWVYHIEYKPVI